MSNTYIEHDAATLEHVRCWCGCLFGAPASLIRIARENPEKVFYCPLGHANAYRISDKVKLESQIVAMRAELDQARAAGADEFQKRLAEERKVSAAKGRITKLKNRISAGVCPCCNRFFSELASHVKTEHPGFKGEEES